MADTSATIVVPSGKVEPALEMYAVTHVRSRNPPTPHAFQRSPMNRLLGICLIPFLLDPAYGAEPVNIALDSQPYLEAGLFSDPLLPLEGETVRITVRAEAAGEFSGDVEAALVLLDSQGKVIFKKTLNLVAKKTNVSGSLDLEAREERLYRVKVTVDPENRIEESSEEDNTAEMVLPVLAKGRKLFFPGTARCPACGGRLVLRCAGKKEQKERLFERGSCRSIGSTAG